MKPTFPRLVHTGLGDTVSYKDRFLYSRHDPLKNPETVARKLEVLPDTLLILPSPLLLHGAGALLERLPANCHILCIEIDQQLMAFSLEHAPEALLASNLISIIRTDSPAALTDYIDNLGIQKFRRILPVGLSGGYQLYRTAYDRLIAATDRHLQRYWQNRMTLVHMSRLWVKNIFRNLARNWRSLALPFPVTGKPVVVAGAGESLEHSLESLRSYRDRFFLLSVDTALPVLSTAGVIPDAVVVLEGQLANAGDFIGHGNRRLSLICDLTAHPSTLCAVRGEKYFVLTSFCSTGLLKRLQSCGLDIPLVRPMGSVGVLAVELARKISPAPLFLTGLDFSYIPGKPHSRGAPSHLLTLAATSRKNPVGWYRESMKYPLIEVRGTGGETVTSDLILHSYGLDLGEVIQADSAVYDLRRTGIALNAVVLNTDRDFERVLTMWESAATGAPAGRKQPKSAAHEDQRGCVRKFLEQEISYLNVFLDLYTQSGDRLDDTLARSRLVSALDQVDYVYLDFPDAGEAEKRTPQFLHRTAASAVDFRKNVQRALTILAQ